MRTFLILTEDKRREEVKRLVAAKFEGFTIFYGDGYWVGKTLPHQVYKENNMTIMVLTNEQEVVIDIAREIKELNGQEAVMVMNFETEVEFI